MKIAMVTGRNSATTEVMHHLIPRLRSLGAEVTLFYNENLKRTETFHEFDIVHFSFILGQFSEKQRETIVPPVTGNVWHIAPHRLGVYTETLIGYAPARIFVDDVTTLQTLGFIGFTEVTLVPLTFDPKRFCHLPPPPGPFTVGAFGNNYESKRFDVVRLGCGLAEVDFFDAVQPDGQRIHALIDPIQDVYAHVHALAHASFIDTNFLPGMEALACGRPIVSTRNYGIERVLVDGVNGYFYDGSPRDLARKIKLVEEQYDVLAAGARATVFPDPDHAAQTYYNTFQDILTETETDDTPDQRLQNLLVE